MIRRASWRAYGEEREKIVHSYLNCGSRNEPEALMLCLDTPWVVVPPGGEWERPKRSQVHCDLCEAILAFRKVFYGKRKRA